MRKVILFIATSLDGYIAGPAGEIDWLFQDHDYGYAEFYAGIEYVVMGRKTYETALGFEEWPHPGKQTFVFTRTGAAPTRPEVTFTDEDVAALIRRLSPGDGGHIWLVGGSELIRSFVETDLLDELVVSIHPVLLGSGIPLLQGASLSKTYRLRSVHSYESGLVQLAYTRR